MKTKTKLPPGWEKCQTGIKGVRKWRNMVTQCWVTDHADDPNTLHCGVRGIPSNRPRYLYTPEQAIACIESECADHAETLSSPNTKMSHGSAAKTNHS